MIYVWSGIFIVCALLTYFVWGGREWMKARYPRFFTAIESIEIVGWKKSRTILWARFKVVLGLFLTALTQLGEIDLTPLMPLVPEKYQGRAQIAFNLLPMVISVAGAIEEKIRRGTDTPLEIVALPEAAIEASPVLQEVVAKAVEVKVEAKAIVPTVAKVVKEEIKQNAQPQ